MKSRYKMALTDKLYAVVAVSIEMPSDQRALAETLGVGKEEQQNLIGQAMQDILYLLGVEEP